LQYLIEAATDPGDAVLDFFAGTASTGQAVTQAGAGREFTLVQDTAPLPDTATGTAARKLCQRLGLPAHLASIAAERLRRAGLDSERDFQLVTLR
ncbi:MAG: DNA methyltransferase, partial [Alphaproteobacteria bacterium]